MLILNIFIYEHVIEGARTVYRELDECLPSIPDYRGTKIQVVYFFLHFIQEYWILKYWIILNKVSELYDHHDMGY